MTKGHPIFTNNLLPYSNSDGHAFYIRQCDLLIETEYACFFFRIYYLLKATTLIPANTAFDSLILDYRVKLEILLTFLFDDPFTEPN